MTFTAWQPFDGNDIQAGSGTRYVPVGTLSTGYSLLTVPATGARVPLTSVTAC